MTRPDLNFVSGAGYSFGATIESRNCDAVWHINRTLLSSFDADPGMIRNGPFVLTLNMSGECHNQQGICSHHQVTRTLKYLSHLKGITENLIGPFMKWFSGVLVSEANRGVLVCSCVLVTRDKWAVCCWEMTGHVIEHLLVRVWGGKVTKICLVWPLYVWRCLTPHVWGWADGRDSE